MTLEQRKHFEYVRDVMHGDEEKEDKFCDNNCVWTDHHPDCVRSNKPEPVGFVVDLYNGANTPSLPPTAMVAWLNDNPKIGQILYTTPPQRKPLPYEKVVDLWLARFDTNEYDEVFMSFARAIEAAHGIKEQS